MKGASSKKFQTLCRLALAANGLAVVVALALIWIPEVRLYWAGSTQVSNEDVLRGRTSPALITLAEIGDQSLLTVIDPNDRRDPNRLRQLGEGVITGNVQFGQRPTAVLPFPFRAAHLDAASEALQIAGLGTVRLLLGAYTATLDRRFLDAALEETLAFNQVDDWRLVPRGLLWNDHAIAARVSTLALLWSFVRSDRDLDPGAAQALLELVDRTGARLAKPELYNSRTNHGIMQNIALIQLAVAFPTLPRAEYFKTVGCSRIVKQVRYYVDPEGPVLEHSAGYHEFGRELLVKAIRLFELGGCPLPSEWPELLERVTQFSHLLERPDRTLPVYGNTDHAPLAVEESIDVSRAPAPATRLYDVAGVALAWRGTEDWPRVQHLSQTAVTWSNFPTRAHKHADDMAIVVWAQGRAWLTNSGYWPYGAEGFDDANGWRGSNAPHFQGEPSRVERNTILLGAGASPSVSVIDLERRLAQGAFVRRQIVEVGGNAWLVLDSASHPKVQLLESLWTTMPETKVEAVGQGEFVLRPSDSPATARLIFAGAFASPPVIRWGSLAPFGGWIVRAGRPTPAPSIEVQQRADRMPRATVLKLGEQSASVSVDATQTDESQWTISVKSVSDGFVIRRMKDLLLIQFADGRNERVQLVAPTNVEARRRDIVSAYEEAMREFPGVRELTFYRYRLTMLALLLLAAQELVIAGTRRFSRGSVPVVRTVASLAWLSFGLLSVFWYLR